MSNLKIYQLEDGVSTPFPNVDSQIEIFDYTYNAKRMGGAPSISATVKFATCLDDVWTDNVYVEFKGEKYFLKQTPTSSYSNDDERYKHELELVSERIILDNVYFYDVVSDQDEYKPVTNSSKVAFFGTIGEFAQRMNHSLQYAKLQTYVNEEVQGYHVIVDDGVESEGKLITFEDQYFSNVLQEIYNVYELPYYFIGKEIHIGFKDSELSQTFQYGLTNELLSITKTNANAMVVNRATGQGSTDNIPYYYPNMSEKGDLRAVYCYYLNGVIQEDFDRVIIINPEKYGKKISTGESLEYKNVTGQASYFLDTFQYRFKSVGNWKPYDNSTNQTAQLKVKLPTWDKVEIEYKVNFRVTKSGVFDIPVTFSFDAVPTWNSSIIKDAKITTFASEEEFAVSLLTGETNKGFRTSYLEEIDEAYVLTFKFVSNTIDDNSHTIVMRLGDLSPLDEKTWYATNLKQYVSLKEVGLKIKDGYTVSEGHMIRQDKIGYIQPQETLMPPIYRESDGDERFYNALNETYTDENGEYIDFLNPYVEGKPKEVIVEFEDIKPTIVGIKNNAGQEICKILDVAFDTDDNNETEEIDGTLEDKHPYFFVKLAKTDGEHPFNIFDSAIDEGEMTMAMTSGHCGGCEFTIMVSDDDLKMNTVQVDENGNLVRDDNGNVLCGREPYQSTAVPQDQQNDTIENEVWIALKKDKQTFGRMMPEGNIKPVAGDTFVILHINLPQAYIKYAEDRLEQELIKYIKDNNEEKFTFSIKFSRIYLAENPNVANAITENALLNVSYNGYTYPLYVSSYSYKVSSNDPLPEITVELKDEITVNQNAIQNAITEVKGDFLQTFKNIDIIGLATPYFLRKDINDRSEGKIAASLGFEAGGYAKGKSGAKIDEYGQAEFENVTSRDGVVTESISTPNFVQGLASGIGGKFWIDDDGKVNLEVDNITARQSLTVMELILQEVKSVGGELVVSASNGEIEEVVTNYKVNDNGVNIAEYYTIKLKDDAVFMDGDLIRCSQWDMANNTLRSYWVQFYPQTDANGATGNTGIVYASDFASGIAPQVGDKLVQMGNVSNNERQGIIIISALNNKPYISVYDNVSQPNIESANLKGRFGDLSGLTFDGKTLSGYGIWSDNAYLNGDFMLSNYNKTITEAFSNTANSGRNLLVGTNKGIENWRLSSDLSIYTVKQITYNTAKGVQFVKQDPTQQGGWETLSFPLRPQFIKEGNVYHLSFDMMQSAENNMAVRFGVSLSNLGGLESLTNIVPINSTNINGVWQHIDVEFKATANGTTNSGQYVYFNLYRSASEWTDVAFVNLKLEESLSASLWSPAPEDVENTFAELKVTTNSISAKVGEIDSGLADTGIDIENKKVTLTANDFIIKNNADEITSSVDGEGNWSTNALTTLNSDNTKAITVNHNNDAYLKFYYPNTDIVQMEMGWDAGTRSLMRYYDANGNMLWKIGDEKGFSDATTKKVVKAVEYWYLGSFDEVTAQNAYLYAANQNSTNRTTIYGWADETSQYIDNYYFDTALTMPVNGYLADVEYTERQEGDCRVVRKVENGYMKRSAEAWHGDGESDIPSDWLN